MLEGSRLQPGDVLDASQPARVGHQPYTGVKDDPDRQTENQMNARATRAKKSLKRGSA